MTFPLSVFAIDRELFMGNARSVSVPGALGRMQILPHHISLVSALEEGDVAVEKEDGGKQIIPIAGGVIEVNGKEVVVLVNF